MKKAKLLCGACLTALMSVTALTACGGGSNGADKYDKNNRLILNLRNVYFDQWNGEDNYTEILNEMFGVKIKATNYSYSSWDTQVGTAINGDNLTDAIQYNLKAYNFGSSYEKWVGYGLLKPLPDDMSRWPEIQKMLNNISNIDYLKVDGKLYGIPIANDISNPTKDFSNMTYVYRRDWAKQIDEMNKNTAGWTNVYKEGDVYTWEEFNRLLTAFKTNIKTLSGTDKADVLVDEAWGFPSVANFYKNAPHCYTKDSDGKAINAFTAPEYLNGLDAAKELVANKIYSPDQCNWKEEGGDATTNYLGGKAAVLYDNFSFSNYLKLRTNFKNQRKPGSVDALNDGTAFLKIKGPDGKFAIENTENWFSMTMFNHKISDTKLEKILDVINYLLTDEGTRLAIYGQEGYDYTMDSVTGEVTLNEMSWEKNINTGEYAPKTNGAKYLRYMATLGNDTKAYDPYTDLTAYNIFNAWNDEMKAAKEAGDLRIIVEPADISWMSTATKNKRTKANLDAAKGLASDYCYGDINQTKYINDVEGLNGYKDAIDEINAKLGK
ncbi:MAG: hypothetical protein J6T25_00990 [Bacilli bacterium]|nr:hypothetical protein [Bacilli bacterium]